MKGGYPLTSVSRKQRVYSGHFVGINGASPTTYVLDDGVTVTRTGEGVWDIVFPQPVAGFKACIAQLHENDGTVRNLDTVVRDVANRKITVTHKKAVYERSPVAVMGSSLDISGANTSYAVAPIAGTVTLIQTQVLSGGASDGDAVLTGKINGTDITNGAVTIATGAAANEVDSASPTAANTVDIGDKLTLVSNGGGGVATTAVATWLILPTALAAEDVVDEIHFLVTVELSDIPGAGV